ncbi:hypothetical protein HanXRQr2_Chr08g0320401 [Helianthus annuus]|uniref:Uncharacterized protein n=1 Tax=Helianthus annuus TaxID=4232 RepID=A0A9K3NB77_HELAN|nr:hypothetical protein HanXRQr2_Chr08g0320401 [Helianthus annuus]KAJ0629898.1 hypothetical protein HanHA89_Chr00c03g0733121 [Helianthus annuus]KAJ0720975.1 hypothetical protein HanOQP8_Chr08g0270011 [Helianthus annuus]
MCVCSTVAARVPLLVLVMGLCTFVYFFYQRLLNILFLASTNITTPHVYML